MPAIDERDLQEILSRHEEWLAGGARSGGRAQLDGRDLQNAVLSNANLRQASLAHANLAGANLSGASFREADLRGADLTNAVGLSSAQLSGADLSEAKLPSDFGKFDGLAQAAELSKNASHTFVYLVFACLYSWVTIATTTDARLLTSSVSSPLPIIQTPIPLFLFYIVAPFIVAAMYLYLHLQLQELWREIGVLPAVFPDGRSLSNKMYPWLLAPLVRRFGRRDAGRSLSDFLETAIAWLSAWCLGPFTLVMFWARYLPRHDWVGSLMQVGLLGSTMAIAIWSQQRVSEFHSRRSRRFRSVVPAALGVVVIAAGAVLSYGAIAGMEDDAENRFKPRATPGLESTVPSLLAKFGVRAFADLKDAAVSERPADWSSAPAPQEQSPTGGRILNQEVLSDENASKVVGAGLAGKQLRYASARSAFLVHADLSRSDLRGADLSYAYLQRASLEKANLQLVYLWKANLARANLRNALLQTAYLGEADLREADLRSADLRGAILVGANLKGAHLQFARLDGAMLANADLEGATLDWASLHGANLAYVRNLTADQIRNAFTDNAATAPAPAGCGVAGGKPPELVNGVYTITLKSDGETCSSMMWPPGDVGTDTMRKLDEAAAAASFTRAVVGRFFTRTPIPKGAPAGTQVVNIPPGDGRSGYFQWTFVAPRSFSSAHLVGHANVDDLGRVFLNGKPISDPIFSATAIHQYDDVEFHADAPALFEPGAVNTIVLSDVNAGIGPSGAAFYAEITFRK